MFKEEKLEYITRIMEKQIGCLYYTKKHLEGDFMKYLTGDKFMIHHGLSIQPRGARGGVAIILSFFLRRMEKRRTVSKKRSRNYGWNYNIDQSSH